MGTKRGKNDAIYVHCMGLCLSGRCVCVSVWLCGCVFVCGSGRHITSRDVCRIEIVHVMQKWKIYNYIWHAMWLHWSCAERINVYKMIFQLHVPSLNGHRATVCIAHTSPRPQSTGHLFLNSFFYDIFRCGRTIAHVWLSNVHGSMHSM